MLVRFLLYEASFEYVLFHVRSFVLQLHDAPDEHTRNDGIDGAENETCRRALADRKNIHTNGKKIQTQDDAHETEDTVEVLDAGGIVRIQLEGFVRCFLSEIRQSLE